MMIDNDDYLELLQEARIEADEWFKSKGIRGADFIYSWLLNNPESYRKYWSSHHWIMFQLEEGIYEDD